VEGSEWRVESIGAVQACVDALFPLLGTSVKGGSDREKGPLTASAAALVALDCEK
jgi:hypothetical protein